MTGREVDAAAGASERSLLLAEVEHFHERLFGGPPPPEVAERYVAAHRTVFGAGEPDGAGTVRTVVERRLDVEAVEYALRLRGGGRTLTDKLRILYPLVEVRAAYRPLFVNERPGRWRGTAKLLAATARSAWLYAKGRYLARRHGLA